MSVKHEAVAVREPNAATFGDDGKCFRLTSRGLRVEGKPTFPDFRRALNAAHYLEEQSPFWHADLLAYAKTRPDWEKWIDQVVDAGKYTKQSADRMASLGKRILPPGKRVEGLSLAHHAAVVTLSPEAQVEVLEQAKADHLSADETFQRVRKLRGSRKILKGQSNELAKLQEAVANHAWDAAQSCREITKDDCKLADAAIRKARHHLDGCSVAVAKLKKAQGAKP